MGVSWRRFVKIFCGVSCFAFSLALLGQNTAGWTVNAPPDSLQLVAVAQLAGTGLRFTFKNISTKAILTYSIATPGGTAVTKDFLMAGASGVGPGSDLDVEFDVRNFNNRREILVAGVVYSDGSQAGSATALAMLDDMMLGSALETKRVSTILSSSPDASIGAVPWATAQIGSIPSTPQDSARLLQGISLDGIPQIYIDSRIQAPSRGFMYGVEAARGMALGALQNKRSDSSRPLTKSPVYTSFIQEARLHGVSDLAAKYRNLAAKQVTIIQGGSQWLAH